MFFGGHGGRSFHVPSAKTAVVNTDQRRLRKFARKKRLAFRSRNPRLERYLTLYWRYWRRVYGPHERLWNDMS